MMGDLGITRELEMTKGLGMTGNMTTRPNGNDAMVTPTNGTMI